MTLCLHKRINRGLLKQSKWNIGGFFGVKNNRTITNKLL